jgi:hypothetical protein
MPKSNRLAEGETNALALGQKSELDSGSACGDPE